MKELLCSGNIHGAFEALGIEAKLHSRMREWRFAKYPTTTLKSSARYRGKIGNLNGECTYFRAVGYLQVNLTMMQHSLRSENFSQ